MALELQRRRRARRSLLDFIQYTKPDYRVGWHHRILCDAVDRWVAGEILRLMVFMPPQHGKSEIVSRRLPAYLLGRFPDTHVMASSYTIDLAHSMSRDAQRIIDSPEYRILFPGTRLFGANIRTLGSDGTWLRNSDEFEVVGRRGYYKCAGVGGGLTGRNFHHGIIDDPIKGRADADSQAFRDRLWAWYLNDFYSRQAPGARRPILLTLTRWHEDDLAGRLIRAAADGGDSWHVVVFPYEAEGARSIFDGLPGITIVGREADERRPGDPLWPEAFGREAVLATKGVQDSRTWSALYQQRPAPLEGGVFKRAWFQRRWRPTNDAAWIESDNQRFHLPSMLRFGTVDLAASVRTSADYTVLEAWAVYRAPRPLRFLLDVVRGRMEGPDIEPAIRALMAKWGLRFAGVESTGFQLALVQQLRRNGIPVREIRRDTDKLARAMAVTPACEAGEVVLPERAHWLSDFEAELFTFPNGANDDQVDPFSDHEHFARQPAPLPTARAPRVAEEQPFQPDGPNPFAE